MSETRQQSLCPQELCSTKLWQLLKQADNGGLTALDRRAAILELADRGRDLAALEKVGRLAQTP
jgi:hypothetical protein